MLQFNYSLTLLYIIMSNLLANYIDNFFEDSSMSPVYQSRRTASMPSLNIKEYDDKYEITLTVPGLDEENINIETVDNTLKISYDHDLSHNEESGNMIREEYTHYSFSRSVLLPNNIDKESIEAHTKKGILNIELKKIPETKPKKIRIKKKD